MVRAAECFFAALSRNKFDDQTARPPGASPQLLTTWADLVSGPDPDDPADNDNDGLPDSWERRNY